MSVSVVGKRYAKALLELSVAAGIIDRAARDLRDFAGAFAQSRELRAVFENPGVPQQSRHAILRDIAQQTSMSDQVRDLLLLLADRRRLRYVGEVADAFDALAEARSGKIRAQIITAIPLSPAYYSELERSLAALTGKQVVVTQQVDASLIGGVVTRVGDQVFDGSVKSRLSELQSELLRSQ